MKIGLRVATWMNGPGNREGTKGFQVLGKGVNHGLFRSLANYLKLRWEKPLITEPNQWNGLLDYGRSLCLPTDEIPPGFASITCHLIIRETARDIGPR